MRRGRGRSGRRGRSLNAPGAWWFSPRWLASSTTSTTAELDAAALTVCALAARAGVYCEEASGHADVVAARERCFWALESIVSTLAAASWTEDRALDGINDDAERLARAGAGPCLDTLHALRAYLTSHPGATHGALRAMIREAFASR